MPNLESFRPFGQPDLDEAVNQSNPDRAEAAYFCFLRQAKQPQSKRNARFYFRGAIIEIPSWEFRLANDSLAGSQDKN